MANKRNSAVSACFFLRRQLEIYITILEFDVSWNYEHWEYETDKDINFRGF